MIIIKIGGGKDINAGGIAAGLRGIQERYLVVHGANFARDELMENLGIKKKVLESVSGYSSVYSDETAIDSIMMAYSGLRNKRIVESFQKAGINAVGLSGIDGQLIRGKRNNGTRIKENGKIKIVRDFSGKPHGVNAGLLNLLLDNGYVPVLCIPIIDEQGYAINSENDDIVAALKDAIGADTIINLIEAPGLLEDKNDPRTLIKNIGEPELEQIEKNTVGRMKRKILSIRKLLEKGRCRVIISDGRTMDPVKDALEGKGTIIG